LEEKLRFHFIHTVYNIMLKLSGFLGYPGFS